MNFSWSLETLKTRPTSGLRDADGELQRIC